MAKDSQGPASVEPTPRKIVTKRLRFEIFRRDDFACRYCGLIASESGEGLTIDHVIPLALGGTNDPDNLVTACRDCNAGKSSVAPGSPLVEDVAQDALRWADAMKRAAAIRAELSRERNAYIDAALAHWHEFKHGDDKEVPHPPDARMSIGKWYDLHLPIDLVIEAIDVAMNRKNVMVDSVWRYMCGVAWRTLEQLQADAKALLVGADAEA